MNTKIIFNTNKKLKEAAMKKAQKQGLTLSAVLNLATQAYVDDTLTVSLFERDLAIAREQIRQGRGIPAQEVYHRFGIK